MRRGLIWGGMVLVMTGVLGWSASHAAGFPETVERIKGSIVAVGTYSRTDKPPVRFLGTGFAVLEGGHVLTNFHVLPTEEGGAIKGNLSVFYRRGERIRVLPAAMAESDRRYDLALLRLKKGSLPPLRLGQGKTVREGERYAFTGFPIGMALGLHPVTHRGIVSAVTPIATPVGNVQELDRRMIKRLEEPYEVYQLDATAYPGNSGSPLYTPESGDVVGIINKVFVKSTKESLLEKPSGITYAIPVDRAVKLLREAAGG